MHDCIEACRMVSRACFIKSRSEKYHRTPRENTQTFVEEMTRVTSVSRRGCPQRVQDRLMGEHSACRLACADELSVQQARCEANFAQISPPGGREQPQPHHKISLWRRCSFPHILGKPSQLGMLICFSAVWRLKLSHVSRSGTHRDADLIDDAAQTLFDRRVSLQKKVIWMSHCLSLL